MRYLSCTLYIKLTLPLVHYAQAFYAMFLSFLLLAIMLWVWYCYAH